MDYRAVNHGINDNPQLYESLKALPKIELHRHLEGSLRLNTLADIAREHQLDLPGYAVEDFRHLVQMVPEDEPNANVFISKFFTLRNFYQSPEIIDRITYETVADAAAENIVYMELRFTPIALAREKEYAMSDAADWVIKAVDRAQADFGIDVRLIVSMNRHESVELGEEMVDIAIANMDRGVVAIDLAGSENKFPGRPFEHVFAKAREAGLSITSHAGEWAGPESVLEAINVLGAQRLGHGVRIVEDLDAVKLAQDRDITFEVCLSSNILSGVVDSLDNHPFRDLYAMGLRTTLNTDDPSVQGVNLTDEFVAASAEMGYSLDTLKEQVINAAEAAFLPDDERQALMTRLQTELYPESTEAPAESGSK